ncbi:MAG: SMC-Scp complex subunit ScpB [Gammaproteobacteria bacterium]|nr:SMC-Scp complex subunit ScpB [Gammaproteobacteria bacterium]
MTGIDHSGDDVVDIAAELQTGADDGADPALIRNVVETALLVAGQPVSLDRLQALFVGDAHGEPPRDAIRAALEALRQDYAARGIELKEVASGFRVQVRGELAPYVSRLWDERSPRYSRALLETLAIIAYRQPVTRAEIEDIRGVAVSTNMIKSLLEREWIRVAGHRDVPGRPAVYTTTRQFLDYFNLKTLAELPTLAELRDIDDINPDLFAGLGAADESGIGDGGGDAAPDGGAQTVAADLPREAAG